MNHNPEIQKNGKTIINLSLLIVGILIGLMLLEILLRVFWNPPYLDPKYKRNDFEWLSKNVNLNRYGYRDRDFSLEKADDVYRIYILGDSYTYGWYVNDVQESYPKVLEKLLKEGFKDKKIEVINASRPGFNFQMEINRYKEEGLLFNPDLVIVGINSQDLSMNEYPPSFIKNKFIRDLRLYQLTFGNIERARVAEKTYSEIIQTYKDNSKQIKQAKQALNDLKRISDLTETKVAILVFPEINPMNPDEEYKFKTYHEMLRKLGEEYSIKIIDLLDDFKKFGKKKELFISPIDPHPSIIADKIAAEKIVSDLNFKNFIENKKSRPFLFDKTITKDSELSDVQEILSLNPTIWVYFNRKNELNSQKILINTEGKKVPFLEDSMQTVRSFTHDGWPGAKIEMNLLGNSNTLQVPKNLYGFSVVGVSKVSAYWRENKNQMSKDIDFSDLKITKNSKGIRVDTKLKRIDFYKVTVDVKVKQFDIDKGKIVSFSETRILSNKVGSKRIITFEVSRKIGSLPKFVANGISKTYGWIDNTQILLDATNLNTKLNVVTKENFKNNSLLQIPIALEKMNDESESLNIKYISY